MFTGTRCINGRRFVTHIPAASWEEAKVLFELICGTVNGELNEEYSTCVRCKATIKTDWIQLEPVEEEWSSQFEA